MMKSFFKKLAFVMALAMVVSLAAPAATTAAAAEENPLKIAYQAGMAITEVNLMSAGDFEDLKFLGVPNYKELGGATWSSNNEAVATVDNSGIVTAKGEGTAVVTVTIGDMTASVTVNVGTLPTYTVTIGDETSRSVTERTLKIGQSVDFAFYGIKDYSRDKIGTLPRYLCTWQSDDTTVLTKDNEAGLFTAVKAGTAKVTLTVANVLTGKTHNVIPVLVTVEADATPTPTPCLVENPVNGGNWNATQNTVVLTVGEGDEDALELKDFELYRVFKAEDDKDNDGTLEDKDAFEPYEHKYIKSVNYNKKTGVWTLTAFEDFADGATYELRYLPKNRTEKFVASVGAVAKVVIEEDVKAALETEDTPLVQGELNLYLYDAKDVEVSTLEIEDGVKNADIANIFYAFTENDSAYSFVDHGVYEFYEMAEATIVATYIYDELEVASLPLTVEPKELEAYDVEDVIAWTLVEGNAAADWYKPLMKVPADETDYIIATLFQDTRGKYWTTHKASAVPYDVDGDGEKEIVGWTEDEDDTFYKSGLYVEYKAMHPDKMLVEDFGEIASYEEGTARYALYLYNYNKFDDEFVRELDAHNVTVCHPKKLTHMDVQETNVTIMMNTESDDMNAQNTTDANGYTVETVVPEAYYDKFSKTYIAVELWDRLHTQLVKPELAADAEFEITLMTKQNGDDDEYYEDLVALFERYEDELNDDFQVTTDADGNLVYQNKNLIYDLNGNGKRPALDDADKLAHYRAFEIEAADFFIGAPYDSDSILDGRTQLKFTIKETTTNTSKTIVLNLKQIVPTIIKNAKGEVIENSQVALVKEFHDDLKTNVYFEKFVLDGTTLNLDQNIGDHYANVNYQNGRNALIYLYQVDKNGSKIGFDSKLFVSDAIGAKNTKDVYAHGSSNALADPTFLNPGDRVMYVKAPNGKAYPVVGTVGATNAVYSKKEASIENGAWAMAQTSDKLGIASVTAGSATSGTNTAVSVAIDAYALIFRTTENVGIGNELVYAQNGRYTVTIQTVEDVDYAQYSMTKATDKAYFATDTVNGEVVAVDFSGANGNDPAKNIKSMATVDVADVDYNPNAVAGGTIITYFVKTEDDRFVPVDTANDTFDATTFESGLYYVLNVDSSDVDKDKDKTEPVLNSDYGKITYATGAGLKYNVNVNLDNSNPEVKVTKREATVVEGTLPYYEAGRGYDDNEIIREAIMKAFQFTNEGTGKGQYGADDILYYSYTVTPSNKQIVINDVVFKTHPTGYNLTTKKTYEQTEWYRSYAKVNMSITFED